MSYYEYNEREVYGKTDMEYGSPLWLHNLNDTDETDEAPRAVPEKGRRLDVEWSFIGRGVYALRRPTREYGQGQVKVIALQDLNEVELFFDRVRSTHEMVAPRRTRRILGHLGTNMSVAIGSVEMAALPWWASAAGIATAGLSYVVHDRKMRAKQRSADNQEVEAFAVGEESSFQPHTYFTLYEHESGAQWKYWYGDGSREGITQTEQLLKEDCSAVFAHDVGETLDEGAVKERVEALLEWLSPHQGKSFFKKQEALREAYFDAEKYMEIMEGPAEEHQKFSRRLFARQIHYQASNSVFTKCNTLLLALKRMEDTSGFMHSYLSQLQSPDTLRDYYVAARQTAEEASDRKEIIGDSLEAEYLSKQESAILAERLLRHKIYQLSYMAMRWDKGENIPVPPDAVVAREVTTAVWRESLEAINTLLRNSQNDNLTVILGRFYIALQNQQTTKNNDSLNRQLTDYLTAAVAVARTEDHYTAIEREVEQSYGEYLGLSVSRAQTS